MFIKDVTEKMSMIESIKFEEKISDMALKL